MNMASPMTRLRWWVQSRISNHKQDLFIIGGFFSAVALIFYILILSYDAPDMADVRSDFAADQQLVKEVLEEIEKNPHDRIIIRNLEDPHDEAAKFKHVQEKLKLKPELRPPKKQKPKVKDEEEIKINPAKDEGKNQQLKDTSYWLEKYKHIFDKDRNYRVVAPVGGSLRGGKAQCTPYDHEASINETYDCVKLQLDKLEKTQVCLYPSKIDVHLSRYIRMEGIWEPHIVKLFMEYLSSNSDMGFIDIGANIGVYTLAAASQGHQVIAVEPFEENLKHLSQGIQLSHVEDKVIVLQNAISDKRLAFMDLKLDETNQGGIQVDDGNHNYKCYGENCPPQVKAVLFDDLLEVVNFKSAIIKIDIEGHEHRAFRESEELFQQMYIPYILMEWMKLWEYYGSEVVESIDKTMVFDLVRYLRSQGYQAFSLVTGEKLSPDHWFSWPDDVVWKHDLVDHV